jgi:hypothetical protein
MKMKCPRCKRIVKTFTPTETELKLFDEEELQKGEAEHHRNCSICSEVTDQTI